MAMGEGSTPAPIKFGAYSKCATLSPSIIESAPIVVPQSFTSTAIMLYRYLSSSQTQGVLEVSLAGLSALYSAALSAKMFAVFVFLCGLRTR